MDRDKNYNRTQLAYDALVYSKAPVKDLLGGIDESYESGVTDEFVLPTVIVGLFRSLTENVLVLNLIEGLVRMILFIGYIFLISKVEDIKVVFQYHGAEHKCINCIEKGRPLTVANVMKSSRFHRRCGTSFLFIVVFISVIIF